ncbi:hypothetical protein DFQ04_0882 [Algoriphagus boseongensis]|uniref:Uncharacterized protein n=1 Tax=Algoriphagus boseongensis TaxID=1442587 RepID=A0A4R6TBL6_9BACT|nr:hypothetical protein [Algoriphagus boseongensis]TDQ19065.1 hypothetical protein DFQ04_0882 [Algoriphagus boseongensis]
MQETWTFDFIQKTQTEDDLDAFLNSKKKDLGIFLSYYFRKQGAIAENVKLVKSPSFSSPSSGIIQLEFELVHFNACLAINEKQTDQMEVTFEILPQSQQLRLTGPYWPSREMDEI